VTSATAPRSCFARSAARARRTGQFFEQVGLRPGKAKALVAGVAETAGGALLAVGLATPAVAMPSGVQYAAIWKVHADKGP
jgi:putative oxidoreductase